MTEALPTIAAAWTALALAAISPGPNMVAVASRGLGSGRQSGLTVALGIAIGAFGWATLTALGLGALFKAFPGLLRLLGLCGGAYLMWLGFKGWRAALTASAGEIAPQSGQGLWRDMSHGLVVTATNPKVAVLWASLSTFVGGATSSTPVLLIFAGVSAGVVFTIYGTYGLLFSTGGIRRLYARFQRLSEASFGTVFGVIGAAMLWRAAKSLPKM